MLRPEGANGPRSRQQKSTDPFLPYLRERLAAYPGRELLDRGYAGGYTAGLPGNQSEAEP
jgi:hypothetical protein